MNKGASRISQGRVFFAEAIIIILISLLTYCLEPTPIGHWLEFETFSTLSGVLGNFDKDLPVVVVAIDKLPSGSDQTSSRELLRQLIEQIAADEPAAIGVDIDFSPQGEEPNPRPPFPEDQDFFDFCLGISKGTKPDGVRVKPVPVFVGVHRTVGMSKGYWLGYREFASLATLIGSFDESDSRWITRWTSYSLDEGGKLIIPKSMGHAAVQENNKDRVGNHGEKPIVLPSMGQALAEAYLHARGEELPKPAPWFAGLVELMPVDPTVPETKVGGTIEEVKRPALRGVEYGRSLANYSKLYQISGAKRSISIDHDKAFVSGTFRGMIVLLGDTETSDVFTIPGPAKPLRGVFQHACAAYTFALHPFYELRRWVRVFLDVLLSILLVGIHWRLETAGKEIWSGVARVSMLLFALAIGVFLVRVPGILWFDFFTVVLVLNFHPQIRRWLEVAHERRQRGKAITRQGLKTHESAKATGEEEQR